MLIHRSAQVVPHWYMYPPKTSYRDTSSLAYDELGLEALARCNAYVHIPFCNMKCSFCSLFTSSGYNQQAARRYVNAVCQEIDRTLAANPKIQFSNLYIGGGTPAVLRSEDTDPIIERFNTTIPKRGQTRTVEFSPDSVSEISIATWRRHGFNRASLGVQSFDEQRLRSMRRIHSGADALRAIRSLVVGGFDFVNVDLIFGGYKQTTNEWLCDLERLIDSGADSCTFHPMARVDKTEFERKQNTKDTQLGNLIALHAQAIKLLASAGWVTTSAISFSKTGTPNPIEHAEAFGVPTIGFGAGARSYLRSLHFSTLPAQRRLPFGQVLNAYYQAVEEGRKPALSLASLSNEEIARRALVLQLHHGRVSKSTLDSLASIVGNDDATQTMASLVADHLAVDAGSEIALHHDVGPLVANLGLALSSHAVQNAIAQTEARATFSA